MELFAEDVDVLERATEEPARRLAALLTNFPYNVAEPLPLCGLMMRTRLPAFQRAAAREEESAREGRCRHNQDEGLASAPPELPLKRLAKRGSGFPRERRAPEDGEGGRSAGPWSGTEKINVHGSASGRNSRALAKRMRAHASNDDG